MYRLPLAPALRPLISVAILGTGQVGHALATQLRQAQRRQHLGVDLRLVAIANSRQMWLAEDDPELNARCGAQCWRPADLDQLTRAFPREGHTVVLDASASEAVSDRYAAWLSQGHHVIAANKRAGSGPLERFQAIQDASRAHHRRFRYEATVGAGLPVIQTLRDLVDTGDALHHLQAVLSGSLAWLFHGFDGSGLFSERVRQAMALGYTEPDPRDDLSGRDVARKLVILAREAGLPVSLADIAVESLVPEALAALPLPAFLDRLGELDGPLRARQQAAAAEGKVLRHLAQLDAQGQARVAVEAVDPAHPLAQGHLTDNLIAFTTARYAANPLVIRGPGAGADVTAAGMFTDVLRLVR